MAREALKQACFGRIDAEMAQLHLRLSPGQRGCAYEGVRLVMLVHQVQRVLARRCGSRPECDVHGRARRHPHALPQHEHRVEDRADRIGQSPAIQHRDGPPDPAPAAEKPGSVGLDLRLAERLAFNDCMMGRPDLRLGGRAPPPGCQDGALLGDIFGLHEELRERRMRRVGCGERERQLAIGRDLDVAHAVAAIRDRYATNLGVILRRNDDLQGRRDHCITAYEFRTILGEGHLVAVGLDAARLIARGPHGAAFDVAQEEIAAAIVACRVFAPARDVESAPAAVARACIREHHGVAAIREQMRLRRGCVRREQTAHLRELHDPRRRRDFLGPRMRHRDIARRALLQQKLGRLDARLRVEPLAHPAIEEHVGESHHGHARVMGHERAHGRNPRAFWKAAARVVERLIEPVASARAAQGELLEIAHRASRIDHRRECRSVRRYHCVFTQAALEPEAGHAEVRILVGELEVAHVVGGLRNAPRDAELGAVADLAPDDQAAGLFQKTSGRCTHDERRHQVLEHRARPGNERRPVSDRSDRAPEAKPMPRRHVALGDRHEARQARLGSQQVITARVQSALGSAVADGEKPALCIEQETELHRLGHGARRQLDVCQAPLQAAGLLVGLRDIAAPTLDRALRRLRPEEYVGARVGAEFAGQHSRDVDQGRGVRCAVRESRRELPGHGRAVAQRGREDIEGVFDLTMRDQLPQGLARESQGIVDTGKRLAK